MVRRWASFLIRTPSDWGVASASGVLGASVLLSSVGNASSYVTSFLISSVLFVRLACGRLLPSCLSSWGVLPCPVGGLDGLVGHLICCVSLATGFSSLWYCSLPPPCHGSSMCLDCQAQVSSSHFTFLVFVSALWSVLTSRLLFVVSQR